LKKIIVLYKKYSSNTFREFVRFCIVGVINTSITLSVIFVLMNLLNVDYKISNVIGYILGFINSFILNKFWTFKSQKNIFKESFLFILVFVISYLVNFIILIVLVENLYVNKNFALLGGMICYTFVNYSLNKIITFKKG